MIILHVLCLVLFFIGIGPVLKEILHKEATFSLFGTLLWAAATTVLIEIWRMEL